MAHTASLLNSKSEFDSFLYAPVGEDKKGTIVSVLTAFARLNFEPWQKAADFASLPKDVAKTRLAAMIATLPGMSPTSSEPGMVAARLIALLPASARPSGPAVQPTLVSRNGLLGAIQAADLRSPRNRLIIFMMALWLVFQVVWVIQQPSQPVGNDAATTSQPAGPPTH
jgi:hypothetical protein